MKELIKYIAQALVDNPEQVSVRDITGEHTIILELKVAKEDIGMVIGKKGRTAQALRAILNAVSGKEKKRITLEILD